MIQHSEIEKARISIQEAKHRAQLATAECARDNDWDSEAYYRAKAEGLQEAERLVEAFLNDRP